jgi:hypothetical protein
MEEILLSGAALAVCAKVAASRKKRIKGLEGDRVTMPLWYCLKIPEYVVDVEKIQEHRPGFPRIA